VNAVTHSVLAPHGSAAAEIATLTWMLFAGGAFVMAVVAAVLWAALRGPPRIRRKIASTKAVLILGAAFPVVTLTVLLVVGLRLTAALSAQDAPGMVKIEVRGEQWWWRVRYHGEGGQVFDSANEIRIPVGRPVRFELTAADVIHSFWIPSLAGKMDMIPGRATSLRVNAIRPGIYRGVCAEYCGGPHALMAFDVIAMPAADYDAWLRDAGRPADTTGQGHGLFIRAGCGGCHTIAGTAANGTIGPSLTKLGERRSIAAGTLPMSEANLARFVAQSQHVKPANRMPPFDIFSAAELKTLAAYLAGLR
jgi:cytochrome c oxidase subunit 2